MVEFQSDLGTWVANFRPGISGIDLASPHPNNRDAVVIAAGDLWVVDVVRRSAQLLLPAIESSLEVSEPSGWIFSRQGLALARFGPSDLLWHTKRLSWDGFDELRIVGHELSGVAWSPLDDTWHPFRVDIRSGRSEGGSFGDNDAEGWEKLADV